MRFLFEAGQSFDNILQAKSYLESQEDTKYEDLNETDRINFIHDIIDLMRNKRILKKNSEAVIRALQDSKFGTENQDVIKYINEINNDKIDNGTMYIILQLIMNGSIDYQRDKQWLNNKSIYDRPVIDADYVIKVLALASNPKLQKDYFEPKLKVNDFIDSNGRVHEIPKIKDILDAHQVNDVELDNSGERLISDQLNKNSINIDDVRNYTKSIYGDKLKDFIIAIIDSNEFEELLNSENVLTNNYKDDKFGKGINKLNNTLKTIISKIYNSDDYVNQREQQADRDKKDREDKEKGKRGFDILSDILQSRGQEANKENVLNYIKDLFADNNKKRIISDAIDNGVVNKELNKVLNSRYKETLISSAKELLDYAIQEAILKVIDG